MMGIDNLLEGEVRGEISSLKKIFMSEIYELEFIGRGGQGAKTAAELVARSALKKGLFVQSFPDYGPERKGAPVRAFTRTSHNEIRGCSSEANPNVIIILDPTLLALNGTLFTLNEKQTLLVNTNENIDDLRKRLDFNGSLHTIDATKMALDLMKSPITNTIMAAALAKITGFLSLEELKDEINEEFGKKLDVKIINLNYAATEKAFNEVR